MQLVSLIKCIQRQGLLRFFWKNFSFFAVMGFWGANQQIPEGWQKKP
jgi:hypothetical protein